MNGVTNLRTIYIWLEAICLNWKLGMAFFIVPHRLWNAEIQSIEKFAAPTMWKIVVLDFSTGKQCPVKLLKKEWTGATINWDIINFPTWVGSTIHTQWILFWCTMTVTKLKPKNFGKLLNEYSNCEKQYKHWWKSLTINFFRPMYFLPLELPFRNHSKHIFGWIEQTLLPGQVG